VNRGTHVEFSPADGVWFCVSGEESRGTYREDAYAARDSDYGLPGLAFPAWLQSVLVRDGWECPLYRVEKIGVAS